jgi:2-aminoethylphosphonate-pyruvate transaminase
MLDIYDIPAVDYVCAEDTIPDIGEIETVLASDPDISHVACVHCETTSGILNPVEQIGELVNKAGKVYFIDSMSAFGGIPFRLQTSRADFLVSSSNKCIQGIPGFSFVICNKESLLKTKGLAKTLSLDLFSQWQGLENNGQFRFTPPTHTMLAFRQALQELFEEGGVNGRFLRYQKNNAGLISGMKRMGFKPYLSDEVQSPIITSFRYPKHANFDFEQFYQRLAEQHCIIYPGKLTHADCFRIGNIGHLFEEDIERLLKTIAEVIQQMSIDLPLKS